MFGVGKTKTAKFWKDVASSAMDCPGVYRGGAMSAFRQCQGHVANSLDEAFSHIYGKGKSDSGCKKCQGVVEETKKISDFSQKIIK